MRKRKGKAGHVYIVFFASYVVILLLAMSCSLVLFARANNQFLEQNENAKIALLEQLKIDFENKTGEVEDFVNSLVFNSDITYLLRNAVGYKDLTLRNMLKNYNVPKTIFDYFLYITKDDTISNDKISSMKNRDYYSTFYNCSSEEYVEAYDSYLTGFHARNFYSMKALNAYGIYNVRVIPYVTTFPLGNAQTQLGNIVAMIDADAFVKMADQVAWATKSNIYIIDREGQVLLSSRSAPLLPDESITNIMKEHLSFQNMIGNHKYKVTALSSNNGDFYFAAVTPMKLVTEEQKSFFIYFGIISALFLLISLFIISKLTTFNYKPIREINEMLESHSNHIDSTAAKNEFHTIKQSLDALLKDSENMRGIIKRELPIIKNTYLMKLLKGFYYDENRIRNALNEAGIQFTESNFITVSIEYNTSSPFFNSDSEPIEKGLSVTKIIMENVGCELFSASFHPFYAEEDLSHVTFLINLAKEAENNTDTVAKCCRKLLDFCEEYYQLQLYIGISSIHSSLSQIKLCYDESQKALEYSKFQSAPEYSIYGAMADPEEDYYYPTEIEYRLIGHLKASAATEAKQLIESILDTNFNSKKISVLSRQNLVYEMAATVIKAYNSALVSSGKPAHSGDSMLEDIMGDISYRAILQNFYSLIDDICSTNENRNISKTEALVNKIERFILDESKNQWIDLNILSDKFGVTTQYISSIFKRYRDENIKDFTSKIKLEEAKRLLRESNLTTKEISQKLGYANEIGIIRLFKKYENRTPGEYRAKPH